MNETTRATSSSPFESIKAPIDSIVILISEVTEGSSESTKVESLYSQLLDLENNLLELTQSQFNDLGIYTVVAMISHDITRPIRAVYSVIDLIEFDGFSDNLTMTLTKLKTALKIIKDLLLENKPVKTELGTIFDAISEFVRYGSTVESSVPKKDLPKMISVINPYFLIRHVYELVQNAIKYGAQGVNIKLSLVEQALEIKIVDNGSGMSTDRLNLVRQAIRSQDAALLGKDQRIETSSGRGLVSIVTTSPEISMSVDSTESVGTTVTLSIPLIQISES